MAAEEAVLANLDATVCPCGCSSHESVDSAIVCSGCGRVLQEEFLVKNYELPSSGHPVSDNIVPEGCTGAHLTGGRCTINYRRRATIKRLQAQASNHGRHLELSNAAISTAHQVIQDYISRIGASETSAIAAALVLGARIEGFPVAMKDVCLRLEVPFSDFRRSFAILQRNMPSTVPSLQVDEMLKRTACTFSAARSLSKQVTSQLLSLSQRLLQFARRYITPSVVLSDAATCVMLAIELIVGLPPDMAVTDDLYVGTDSKQLQRHCQLLSRAVYDQAVRHGVVVAKDSRTPGACVHSGTDAGNTNIEVCVIHDVEVCGTNTLGKRKRAQPKNKGFLQPCKARKYNRHTVLKGQGLGLTLHQVRSMLDIDECMAL